MIRKIAPGVSTCSEHGGRFTDREAFDHLMIEHPDVARLGERILDANRDVLPVNPLIAHFAVGFPSDAVAPGAPAIRRPSRRERREAARRARRANGGQP